VHARYTGTGEYSSYISYVFILKCNALLLGHADLTKWYVSFVCSLKDIISHLLLREWLTHQHRDTLSSIVGHPTLLSYLAIADGEATGRVKFEMTEV
jgi:hypothetical protein